MRQRVALVGKGWIGNRAGFFPHSFFSAPRPFLLRFAFSFPPVLPPPFSSFSLPSSTMASFQDPDAGSSSHMMKTTKRGRPFLKVRTSRPQSFHPPHLTSHLLAGHSRSLCHSHRIPPPPSPQAVFPQLSPLIHDVGPLFSDIASPLQFSFPATRPPKI